MVYMALYVQAPIISLISSPTCLLLIHSTPDTLPLVVLQTHQPYSYLRAFALTIYFCQKYSSPEGQQGSLPHLFYVFTQSLCLGETLPIGWGQMPIILQTLPFLCFFFFFHRTSLHLAYIFYLWFITPKRMLFSTKAWVMCVLFDSVPSTPRTLETDEAPNNPLLNKWTLWGLNGIMYAAYMANGKGSKNINFYPHPLSYWLQYLP